jgi:hypothetical protein
MYNVQVIPTHNKQKIINQNYPKENMDNQNKEQKSSTNKHLKKTNLPLGLAYRKRVEFGKLILPTPTKT